MAGGYRGLGDSWRSAHHSRRNDMHALAGAGVGAAVGGLTGALVGMGIPEYEAKRYEGKIKEGNMLISVHSENSDEVKRAKDIFERAGAHDISYSEEKGVLKQEESRI